MTLRVAKRMPSSAIPTPEISNIDERTPSLFKRILSAQFSHQEKIMQIDDLSLAN